MNRTTLTETLISLAAAMTGYSVLDDTADRLSIRELPAVWLMPLRLKSTKGERHGRQTHGVELRLLLPALRMDAQERKAALAAAEDQIIELFRALPTCPCVIAVENLTVAPASGTYTAHGELSQTATADVITYF